MELLNFFSVVLITLALIFYSLGVWGEFFKKTLLKIHVILFWLGLACDALGTTLMFNMAEGISFDIHAISGTIAILLMAVHAIWATIVERSGSEEQKRLFHRYSIVVWLFWLIPYFYPASSQMGQNID